MKRFLSLLLAVLTITACLSIAPSAAIVQQIGYKNIAVGSPYTSTAAYTDRVYPNDYQLVDGKELTDGVYGSTPYGTEWVAYDRRMNATPEIVIDLGEIKTDLARTNMEFRAPASDGVDLPKSVEYFISDDNVTFVSIGVGACEANGANYKCEVITEKKFSARYVKAVVNAYGTFNFASEFEVCVEAMVDVEVPDPDTSGFKFPGTSDIVLADGFICGISPETDIEKLGRYFVNGLKDIKVYDSEGNEKVSGLVASGDIIKKVVEGNVNESATVFIDGDVNKNGKIDTFDYALVKRAYLGTATLDELQSALADLNGNGRLDVSEYGMVKRHYLGTYNLFSKYEPEAPLYESDITLQKVSNQLYKMTANYKGKTITVNLDKKSWGMWNLGTFSYNGSNLAGGGTDWEYVYRANKTGSGSFVWSGGNHGNEKLLDMKIYDSETGEEITLGVGESVKTKGITIVENSYLLFAPDTDGDGYGFNNESSPVKDEDIYAEVTRTYYFAGNKIALDVDYNYIKDVYFQKSYTCMFPIYKAFGRNYIFTNIDGTTHSGKTTDGTVYPDYSNHYDSGHKALKATFWGDAQPKWKFDVEVKTPYDSMDDFSNASKLMHWDMNKTTDKLYFSKYDDIKYTLVEAGTNLGTKSEWTFYVED